MRAPPSRNPVIRALDAIAPGPMHAARRLRDAKARWLASDPYVANRRPVLDGEPWAIDEIEVARGAIMVSGWAFPPMGWLVDEAPRFTVNGRLAAIERSPRPDVAARFWQREKAEQSGVVIRADAGYVDGRIEIAYENPAARLPRGLKRSFHAFEPALEPPLPSAERRYRVIGNRDEAGFLLTGATDWFRIAGAVAATTNRKVEAFGAMLDWGCGCGRLARYASRARPEAFTGCDIDGDNVEWCAANLGGRYVHTGLRPPLPFRDGEFDLAYGVSVFTHLREPLQDAWLAELARILGPGGIALVTVHGETAVDWAGLQPVEYAATKRAIEAAGLLVASANDQLDGAVDEPDEYVNVYHSRRYIQRHWSRWLDVVAIIPGYIYTHDLVVLRRR
jgi:SAM-dependent methyltransferase